MQLRVYFFCISTCTCIRACACALNVFVYFCVRLHLYEDACAYVHAYVHVSAYAYVSVRAYVVVLVIFHNSRDFTCMCRCICTCICISSLFIHNVFLFWMLAFSPISHSYICRTLLHVSETQIGLEWHELSNV